MKCLTTARYRARGPCRRGFRVRSASPDVALDFRVHSSTEFAGVLSSIDEHGNMLVITASEISNDFTQSVFDKRKSP
jgi:hypothetical protein